MNTHKEGSGPYGYSYKVDINGQVHRYEFWFSTLAERELRMRNKKKNPNGAYGIRRAG